MACPTVSTPYGFAMVVSSTTRPTTPPDLGLGRVIYEADTSRVLTYDGTNWVIMSEPSQAYTPLTTNITLGTGGTVVGRYKRGDGECRFSALVTLGTGGVMGSSPTISVPSFGAGNTIDANFFSGMAIDAAVNTYFTRAAFSSTTVMIIYTHGLATLTNITASAPFTWGVGDSMSIGGTFQMLTRYS